MFGKGFVAVPIVILVSGGVTACASKKFVRTSVGEVNDKVETLGRSVEETQERTRKNEGRITEVDLKAQDAARSASQANSAAVEARDAATAVGTQVASVDAKIDTLDRANRRLVYVVVLSEDEGNFRFNNTSLPDDAKQRIDEMVQQLNEDPKNVFIEIEGHTDNVGPKMVNEKIGLGRAEAAQRYLYEQYQIPLHKINIISYGEEKPVAPNNTRAGRAQNRRVVIKVLA
jgi:outer membrane protein OmpA-like peptidoglycan-associated protein